VGSPMCTDPDPNLGRPDRNQLVGGPDSSQNAPVLEPMSEDPSGLDPSASQKQPHDRGPRPQPKKPVMPFQRVGLPSNPRDVKPPAKPARAWNVVVCMGAKSQPKTSYIEAAATLAQRRPDLPPSAITKMVNNPNTPSSPDPLPPSREGLPGGRQLT
jgi:hypothetical protein